MITHPHLKSPLLKEKLPGYYTARAHALNHQTLQHISAQHRERFLKNFKNVQGNEVKGIAFTQGIASIKHDGISAYFYWEQGQKPFLFHCPSWAVEVGLPAADQLATALEAQGHTSALLSCELADTNNRSHSYNVISLLNPQTIQDLQQLRLVLLDVLILDKADQQQVDYQARNEVLQKLPSTPLAAPVQNTNIPSLDAFNTFYQAQLAKGAEGAVLHDLTNHQCYKVKPKFNLDLAIVGYVQGTEDLTGNVVSLMGALVQDNQYQLVARVGIAEPRLRAELFTELSTNHSPSTYTETDSEGRPIIWVKPTKTMEMNAEDAPWQDTDGKPWTNTVITLGPTGYSYAGQGTVIKPFHPTLERIRNDKPVTECTWKQLPGSQLNLKPHIPATTKTTFREVYVKTIKNQPAVRKIIAWERTGDSPRFVIHTTDYSAGRADTLKHDTKLTDSASEAETYITTWRTNEITKGWEKVSPAATQPA